MNPVRTIRIGVIADTHSLFDPAIVRHFCDVDHIIHAGDIGRGSVIEQLEMIAPVTAVSGNVDGYEETGFPTEAIIKLNGFRIAIRHVVFEAGNLTKEGRAFLDRTRPDICIFGHTHQAKNEWLGNTLLFNPGSAGPKRFHIAQDGGNDHDRSSPVGKAHSTGRSGYISLEVLYQVRLCSIVYCAR